MNNIDDTINEFRDYAREILLQQVALLNEHNTQHQSDNKLARLSASNTHFKILKQKLDEKTKDLLHREGNNPQLKTQLAIVYSEYINEYLAISFIKEKE